MYLYNVAQGNPEGTDYSFELWHENKYTKEEFKDICEEAMVETLEAQVMANDSFVSISNIDHDLLYEKFKARGFIQVNFEANYYLEPYWGERFIKNPKLLEWAKGKQHDPRKQGDSN